MSSYTAGQLQLQLVNSEKNVRAIPGEVLKLNTTAQHSAPSVPPLPSTLPPSTKASWRACLHFTGGNQQLMSY